ncbi:MAG: pseudaminic acid synthase, partial [Candidatus Delongbacteria bacterium]|nr:pseudaminic acid synthase [Candidatus Delongbacteria bacterium]
MNINQRLIGPGYQTYVVAEISANHHQNLDEAFQLVETAKECGADAVKLQTYRPETITLSPDQRPFKMDQYAEWESSDLYALYEKAYTPWEWQPQLKQRADRIGIELFSTPFDESAVDFLEKMEVKAYKIASFEIVDLPLIAYTAHTGKPLILSTGMATLGEIEEAVTTFYQSGGTELALLKCVSAYPAPFQEFNLKTIPHLASTFNVISGLSDHSLMPEASIAAVALGAYIIEKHLTLDRSRGGPDARFSLEPSEFKSLVDSIRRVEQTLGEVNYKAGREERRNRIFRPSIYVTRSICQGDLFDRSNL